MKGKELKYSPQLNQEKFLISFTSKFIYFLHNKKGTMFSLCDVVWRIDKVLQVCYWAQTQVFNLEKIDRDQ